MKAALLILLTLGLGVLAANFLIADNGYVLINFRGYLLEMSVFGLLLVLIAAYAAVRIVVHIWRAPRQLGEAASALRRVLSSWVRVILPAASVC
mgnify:CR=1 FL=1